METIRISFEVPNTGGIPVKELTDRARRFVMELVSHGKTDDDSVSASWALSPHTDEVTAAELNRRWEHYQQHPESAIPHENVMEEIRALL